MQHCLRRFCINIGLRLDNKSTTGWWLISYQNDCRYEMGMRIQGVKKHNQKGIDSIVFKINSMLSVFELWSVGTLKYVGLVFVFTNDISCHDNWVLNVAILLQVIFTINKFWANSLGFVFLVILDFCSIGAHSI